MDALRASTTALGGSYMRAVHTPRARPRIVESPCGGVPATPLTHIACAGVTAGAARAGDE